MQYYQKLCSLLTILRDKLLHAFNYGTFQEICIIYKSIAKQLAIRLKVKKQLLDNNGQYRNMIGACMSIIRTILTSTQYIKYGHRLPLLNTVLKKYEVKFHIKSQALIENNCFARIHSNQKSIIYNFINPITNSQYNVLSSSQKIQQFINKINTQQIILYNTQCICCTQVFVKAFTIPNSNLCFPCIANIHKKNKVDLENIQREICAVCNSGGGVLIIGASKEQDLIVAEGIRYQNVEQIMAKESLIHKAATSIQPQINFIIQRVLVHTNYVQPNAYKIQEQFMRICFRVTIFPKSKGINYLYFRPKGFPQTYQVYKINKINNTQRVLNQTLGQNSQGLYNFMHTHYKRTKSLKNSHQNINCYIPHTQYSSIFKKQGYPLLNGQQMQQMKSQQQLQQQEIQQEVPLPIKYSYCSLMVVNTQQLDRHVLQFKAVLQNLKILFTLQKPYYNIFNKGQRSIWMISHQINFLKLKQELQIAISQKFVKGGQIKLMPVYKNLEIQRQKITAQQQKTIQNRFYSKYKRMYRHDILDVCYPGKQPKKLLCCYFENLYESIYTYMIFQTLRLRPYFVKEENDPKKNLDY